MAVASVAELGRTLVLAPHPDDETIGCGGLLALLARAGAAVQVVLLTDGAGSHRQSRDYPAARLRALRWREMIAALRELGHGSQCLSSLGLPDGAVPVAGTDGFGDAVSRLSFIAHRFRPDTVVLPAPDDDHPDHRAGHAIGAAACNVAAPRARRLEYAVWGAGDAGHAVWRIDIGSVLDAKQRALAQHRSQQGLVVHDDPQGFTLPAELLDRCRAPVESYVDAAGQRSGS